jgi:hypothetical protein
MHRDRAGRAIAVASILAGWMAASQGCVRDAQSVRCEGGFWCPRGMKCGADGKSCLPTTCGDGAVQENEQCDPGLDGETELCNRDCTLARCGDGIWNPTAHEDCDPGAERETADCNYDCTASRCGDGVVNREAGEDCDDRGESSRCNKSCHLGQCGDGEINATAGEECDDGSERNDKHGPCLPTCRKAQCGDGLVQTGLEECDDGPSSSLENSECPYGLKRCTLCSRCKWRGAEGPFCGDGVRQQDFEACEEGQRNGATSCDYGTSSCQICKADCSGFSERKGPSCGDGRRDVEAGEACDEGPRNGALTCVNGQRDCTLCSADCRRAWPGRGSFCGDGIRGGAEACDNYASFACGTCSSECVTRPIAKATGAIQVRSTGVSAGEAFAVDDGARAEVFEFVEAGAAPAAGRAPIALPGGADAGAFDTRALAQRIAAAIAAKGEAADGGLALRAELDGSAVLLTNGAAGVNGNRPLRPMQGSPSIAQSPGDAGEAAIVLQGMSGGAGCSAGALCANDDDCAGGTCSSWICR